MGQLNVIGDLNVNGDLNVTGEILKNGSRIGGGGNGDSNKTIVEIIDYDGTIIDSTEYDPGDEFTLPAGPTNHPKLTFQEWVSSAQIVNGKITVGDEGKIIVGPLYNTVSGYVEYDVDIPYDGFEFKTSNHTDVTKNWGDGSSSATANHTYATAGTYTIQLQITSANSTLNQFVANTSGYTESLYAIREVRLSDKINTLGTQCFELAQMINYISFSNTVINYAGNVFHSCYNLKCVIFAGPIGTAYASLCSGCITLKKIIFKYDSTSIMMCATTAFNSCASLEELYVPNSFTGGQRFGNFSSNNGAFDSCTNLKAIYCKSNSKVVLAGFEKCYNLQNIPKGVGIISFTDCYSIKKVENLSYANSNAFQACRSLESVSFMEGITTVSDNSFKNCTALKSVDFSGVTTLKTLSGYTFSGCQVLESISIPDSITTIGNNCFYIDYNLKTVEFGENSQLSSMGNSCFQLCYSLQSITIPSGVTTLSSSVFYLCLSLSSVIVKGDVASIGSNAFASCYALKTLDLSHCTSVPSLSNAMFENEPYLKIIVPDSLYSSWIGETNWATYASKIVKASEV